MRIRPLMTVVACGTVAAATSAGAVAATTGPSAGADCATIASQLATGVPEELTAFAEASDLAPDAVSNAVDAPSTRFIPINAAFEQIPGNVVDAILADQALLTMIIDHHVVPGAPLTAADLAAAGEVVTAAGIPITVSAEGDVTVLDGGVHVVCPDIAVGDSIVHVIDGVLQPGGGGAGGPGSTTPGSSLPGSMPGSVPGSVPPGSVPAFGPEETEVARAFETAVDSSLGYGEQAPFIEDAESLRATIESYPAAAEAVLGISAVVRSVAIDGDTADIRYVLLFNGVEAPYGELDATLVNLDGDWVVPRDVYCDFQAQARNACPA